MISHSKMSDTNTIVLGEKLLAKHWWGKLNADILDKIDKRKSLQHAVVPIKSAFVNESLLSSLLGGVHK